jgi:acetate kinase
LLKLRRKIMKILVLNCGSSSLKYQLIDMDNNDVLAKGLVERIGIDGSNLTHSPAGKDKVKIEQNMENHDVAVKLVIDALLNDKYGVVKDLSEINGVGHRVLHGAEAFKKSVVVTEDVKKTIRSNFDLGPLHMPANLMGIVACEKLMPGVPQVAVFDTSFHQTMPAKAYMYALPYEYYEKYSVRRYGFHGTSHKYVAQRAGELVGKQSKVIICHLGNGSSLSAVKNGEVIDTTMGLTPLEGLVMGTRCGDIDPAIVPYVMNKENLTPNEIDTIMNKKSGVLGVSGISSDFRDVEEAMNNGDERAKLAIDMFRYKVAKYIGEYYVALGGCDAIMFTAGVGENSATNRAGICEYLECLGVKLDSEKNKLRGEEVEISAADSKIKVFICPTNEELMIANDTKELIG